jgi:hypothetical protein
MKTAEKLEITKEIDRIVHKYPRPDSSEWFRSELEYLVKVVIKSLKEPTDDRGIQEERDDICLRCWVEHKEVKREGSGWCSSRWHNYPRHIWK